MDQQAIAPSTPKWRRIIDFPLVALIISLVLLAVATILPPFIVGMITAFHSGPETLKNPEAMKALLNGPYLIPAALIEVAASLLVYKLVIARIGDPPRDDLRLHGAARDGGHGLLAGALIFSLIVGVAALLGVYHIVGGGSWKSFLMILVGMGIMPGFREELLFRGVLFRFIEDFGGSWAALILTSALFGLAHLENDHASLFSSFAIAVEAGLLLGAVYMLTRNLWMAMGLHAAWNFTQGFVWDVPVSGNAVTGLVDARLSGPPLLSGGGFGLESSLIAIVCATALGLFYLSLAVRRGHVERPWWVRRRIARQNASVPSAAEA